MGTLLGMTGWVGYQLGMSDYWLTGLQWHLLMILSIDDRLPPYWRPPPVKDTTSWLCGRLVIS